MSSRSRRPKHKKQRDPKETSLAEHRALHAAPARVHDDAFGRSVFFDPRDLVQVKYEMLRRVEKDGWAVARAARTYGFSRPAFYAARAAFNHEGLVGLLPKRRGPRGPHKLTREVLCFARRIKAAEPDVSWAGLALRLQAQLHVTVHPRSIERALRRSQEEDTHDQD